ncbi:hypothetical protein [Acinetobacter sp. P1(2025)]|uniref:hypothetical protein n=1 Tax=Acinetobacter sp. P1(2025) TaxID=3446120 RepID=UPI003F533FC2
MFNRLRLATLFFGIFFLFMFELFRLPSVAIFPVFLAHDPSGADSNIVVSYFFDFTHIFSSVFIVGTLIIALFYCFVFITNYISQLEKMWLFALGVVLILSYLAISSFYPYIQKLEDSYLPSSNIKEAIYSADYERAYSLIAQNRSSESEKAYMDAQVSLQQYLDAPTPTNQETLDADAKAVNLMIEQDQTFSGFFDDDVMYSIYKSSSIKSELSQYDPYVNDVEKWTYIYLVGMIISFIIFVYHMVLYRKEEIL